jgi:hypothetical protein
MTSILAGGLALLSFGPQKRLGPATALILPAALLA